MSRLQREILGVAYVAQEVQRDWSVAEMRVHFLNRLGLWAIYHYPAGGKRSALNTPNVRVARAAISRAAIRLERRGLLERYRRTGWLLTPPGESIGEAEAGPFRGLIDLRALCALEILRDSPGLAQQWDCTLAELRAELGERVRDLPDPIR
ncbi:hypothetical protein P12x_004812 [Tundrisphaera lichenicola]|uniref:hypothetical protein n=1 Tax=Tundrisphaera lichenicola TaxID=2029860 RepID=UPI003EC0A051